MHLRSTKCWPSIQPNDIFQYYSLFFIFLDNFDDVNINYCHHSLILHSPWQWNHTRVRVVTQLRVSRRDFTVLFLFCGLNSHHHHHPSPLSSLFNVPLRAPTATHKQTIPAHTCDSSEAIILCNSRTPPLVLVPTSFRHVTTPVPPTRHNAATWAPLLFLLVILFPFPS